MRARRDNPTRRLLCTAAALVAVGAVAGAGAASAVGSTPPLGAPGIVPLDPAEEAVGEYLQRLGLRDLEVAQLRARLAESGDASQRSELAERLGRLYAQMLAEADTVARRRWVESLANELLDAVPGAETYGLRIDLLKARYLPAEQAAERARLRLAGDEERADAQRVMGDVRRELGQIADRLDRRIDQLESAEEAMDPSEAGGVREALSDSRRFRSLARYYAGWAGYYHEFLATEPDTRGVEEALRNFGVLLNAPGGGFPEWDRVPQALLRYDHVARSCIGVAMCYSLAGVDDRAIRWLRKLGESEDVSPTIRAQLFSRNAVVYGQARSWAALRTLVNGRRDGAGFQLSVPEARLITVIALSARTSDAAAELEDVAGAALAVLIESGEIGHVLDVARRYGSLPISGEGFIVQYVRGLRAYDDTRRAHAVESGDQGAATPVDRADLRQAYGDAAALLATATTREDAERFPEERARARLLAGLSLYYAGRPIEAADEFGRLVRLLPPDERVVREEALWHTVVALIDAESRGQAVGDRLREAGAVYVAEYPGTDRAARVVLREAGVGEVAGIEAVDVLLGVPRDSPLFLPARRQAAALLFRLHRSANGAQRASLGSRFLDVAIEVLGADRTAVIEAPAGEEAGPGGRAVLTARQLLAVSLTLDPPAIETAEAAALALDALIARLGLADPDNPEGISVELTYRLAQIDLARDRWDRADERLAMLRRVPGRFTDAAERAFYRLAVIRLRENPSDTTLLARVVGHGARVIAAAGPAPEALQDDAIASVYDRVTDAAATLYRATGDASSRELALRLGRTLLDERRGGGQTIARHATLAEQAGDRAEATRTWLLAMGAEPEGTGPWFRARYESIRLLADSEPARARAGLDQLRVLYPEFGVEPWATRLRELDARVPANSAPARPQGDRP